MLYEIYNEEKIINTIISDESFVKSYCQSNGFTYREAPLDPYGPTQKQETSAYIPTPEQSALVMMRAAFASKVKDMDDETTLQCSGLANQWAPGKHKTGDVYNVGDQTWECYSDHDNSIFPDIQPSDPSWYTFNRPLHGKSKETARPWMKPQHGTTDIYHAGEYMVYTDGNTYKCKSETDCSPEEFPADWEKID